MSKTIFKNGMPYIVEDDYKEEEVVTDTTPALEEELEEAPTEEAPTEEAPTEESPTEEAPLETPTKDESLLSKMTGWVIWG